MILQNVILALSNFQLMLIIAMILAVVIGIIFFICACIYHVKDNRVIIVERMQIYYGTFTKGWYWFWPFVYHRVGHYTIEASKPMTLNNGKRCVVKYKIVDPKTFHYNRSTVPDYINKITLLQEKVTEEFLKENLLTIGVELISISEKN